MTDLESAVVEAASILDELSVSYMLIGALALSSWGEARATLDVDVSLWSSPSASSHRAGALFAATAVADRGYVEPRLRELSEAFARQDILAVFLQAMEGS